MDPALKLRTTPAAGTRIGARCGNRGARLAADAAIAGIVQRQVVDLLASSVFPNLAPRPRSEWTDFQQNFSCGQFVVLDNFQILAGRRLFAPQPGEPQIELFEC